jgi:hypothetical protein
MYRPQELLRFTLITPDEVIFHSSMDHEMDKRIILQAIIIAEERFVRPALGDALYEEILNAKNVIVTDINKADLQTDINDSLPGDHTNVVLDDGDIVNAMEFLSPDNLNLWLQYLWKLTAECVMFMAYPDSFIKMTSQGVIHNQAQSSPLSQGGVVTPALASMKWAMDKRIQDRIDPLVQVMQYYICKIKAADKTKFVNYTLKCACDPCSNEPGDDNIAYKNKSGIVLGLYDDEDDHHRGSGW